MSWGFPFPLPSSIAAIAHWLLPRVATWTASDFSWGLQTSKFIVVIPSDRLISLGISAYPLPFHTSTIRIRSENSGLELRMLLLATSLPFAIKIWALCGFLKGLCMGSQSDSMPHGLFVYSEKTVILRIGCIYIKMCGLLMPSLTFFHIFAVLCHPPCSWKKV